jgi:hypothetical protein
VQLRPFRAYFQYGRPIYSPLRARVLLGALDEDAGVYGGAAKGAWTHTSAPFDVAQADVLQTLTLPRPVLCVGGVLRLQLCGRAQTQLSDERWYVCLAHVRATGTPLYGWDVQAPPSRSAAAVGSAGSAAGCLTFNDRDAMARVRRVPRLANAAGAEGGGDADDASDAEDDVSVVEDDGEESEGDEQ